MSLLKKASGRNSQDAQRADEIQSHVDLATAHYIEQGMSPEDARREARLRFGNPRAHRERVDDLNRLPVFDTLGRDLRYAFRTLRRSPAFASTAIGTLRANNQIQPERLDTIGRVNTILGQVREQIGRVVTTVAVTTEQTLIPAVAGEFHDIRNLTFANTGSTPTNITIRDTTGGVTALFVVLAASVTSAQLFPADALTQTTVNTNWTIQLSSVPTSGTVVVTVVYDKVPG